MDRVCFSPPPNQNQCQTGMTFLSVDQGEDLEADRFSGIVGLSPLKSGGKGLEGVISQISNSKVIQPIFSIYFARKGQSGSKITFGGYNVEKFAQKGLKESDIAWIDIDPENKNYWSLPITNNQIKLGQLGDDDGPKPSAFNTQISSTNVIIDSGLSYALIPTKDVQSISQMIKNQSGIDCKPDSEELKSKGSNLAFWKCSDCSSENANKVQPLVFQVGGKELQMPKESFFKFDDEVGKTCKLTLTASDMDTSGQASVSGSFFGEGGSQNWLLGAQFMQNYYAIFDYDKKRVGLVPSKE